MLRSPIAANFDSAARARLFAGALWLLNLAVVFIATHHLFEKNGRGLFGLGWDQQAYQAYLGTHLRFGAAMLGVGMDPVNGLGNIAFPFNPSWFPSYLLSAGPNGFIENWPLAFAVAATELFAVVTLCGRINGFSIGLSLAAAWLLTLTTWPIYAPPKIIALWLYAPHFAEAASVGVLLACAAFRLGQQGTRHSIALAAAVMAGITFMVLARPTFLVLAVPGIAMGAAASFVFAQDRSRRRTIILCWTGVALACLAFGYMHYLAGLFSYTAAGEFPDLGKRLPTLYSGEATLLLWSPFSSLREFYLEPVRLLVAGGALGALLMAVFGSPRQRILGAGLFITEAALVAIGLSNYRLNYWFGPAIWYFEELLFPFFALGCCFLVAAPALLAWRLWSWLRGAQGQGGGGLIAAVNVLLAVLLPLAAGVHASKVGKQVKAASDSYVGYDMGSGWPQPESTITRRLKSEIGLAPGRPFRGRVATMLGRMFPKERYWGRFSLVHYFAQFGTGNLHDGPGLWQDDIPTVFEYSTLMTPAYLAFVRSFLTEPTDIVFRNLIGTRRVDQRILRLIGARFVLTDVAVPGLALRVQLDIPAPPETRKRLEFEKADFDQVHLYLYELPGANLGQFSPVEIRLAKDANESLTLLSNPALDPSATVVVTEPVAGPLVPASLREFAIDKDRYRVRATSTGRSLLVLPVEFSRCLTVDRHGGERAPLLQRADLLLTAIVFEGELDAEIGFRAGPFGASRCRLEDRADSKRIRMAEAFGDRPEFGRLGWQDYWNKK